MNWAAMTRRLRQWRTPAVIALAAWMVIELLLTGQAMHMDAFDLREAIQLTLPRSTMWLVFAPLAVGLAFRFPMERGRMARSLAAHAGAGALLVAVIHHSFGDFANGQNIIPGAPPAA